MSGWLRRGALVALVAIGLTIAVPPSALPASPGFPVGWLTSLFAMRPAGADSGPLLPVSETGHGAGRGGQVTSAATQASGGAGKPQRLTGGLPGYSGQAAAQKTVTPATAAHFNPKTSKRDAVASRADMTVYENADGTQTRTYTTTPANYRAADGSWQPIDSTLVRRGSRWAVKANSLAVSLGATSAAASPVARLSLPGGGSVGWSLAGAAAVTPTVDGATATYPKVSPGTDLELTARPDGVKETLVLDSPQAGSHWVFPLSLRGLTARPATDGSIELDDGAGKAVATIQPPFMEDSSADPKTGLPAVSSAVSMKLVQTSGGQAVEMTADRAWLADPARVYPVRVDPTVTLATSAEGFVASKASTQLYLGGIYLPAGDSDQYGKIRSFLKFDVGSVVTAALPSVSSATLSLDQIIQDGCQETDLKASPVDQAWTPAGLATDSYPGPEIDTALTSTVAVPVDSCPNGGTGLGDRVNVDVTQMVQGWAAGGVNDGLALWSDDTADPAVLHNFAASNGLGTAPQLTVTLSSDLPPYVGTRYPGASAVVPTLTPNLVVRGDDLDTSGKLGYFINVYDDAGNVIYTAPEAKAAAGSTVTVPVPAGLLTWNSTYSWSVQPTDGKVYGARYPKYTFYTRVRQPALGSHLSQNPGAGYDPQIGNYTTSVTDARVAGAGPALEITRSYNSLDTRRSGAFGQGWSSLLDAQVAEHYEASGALQSVAVTYEDGSQEAFGRNPDGSFAPPPGLYEVLRPVKSGSTVTGYTLTEKDGTTYAFGQRVATGVYKLTTVTDANGLVLTITYASDRLASKLTGASGRSLALTWSATALPAAGPHVTAITTDPPAAGGSGYTWTYAYSTYDTLVQACSPLAACTAYTWGNEASQEANTVLDHDPAAFWRLNEPSGATWAASSVLANGGADTGFYQNTTAGSAPPWPGSTSTSTYFNFNSTVALPSGLVADGEYQSISLWFKTSETDGVLFSYSRDPVTTTQSTGNYTPALYVGHDGKLLGEFWDGSVNPIKSLTAVNDGQWHQVVLAGAGSSQRLYLDGTLQGTASGTISLDADGGAQHVYLGAGFLGGNWPDEWASNAAAGARTYLLGQIADVAFFDHTLTAGDVTDLYSPAVAPARQLSAVTSPNGRTLASISMDTVTGKLASMTDSNGGTWTAGPTQVAGSSALYEGAVLDSVPTEYWRLGDAAGTDAVNETQDADATYSAVTLGAAGPFAGDTAASFDGSSSLVSVPGAAVAPASASTQELWFKTTGTNGVLLGVQDGAAGAAATTGLPVLWIDSAGRLRGLSPSTTPTGPLTSPVSGQCVAAGAGTAAGAAACDGVADQSWGYVTATGQLEQGSRCLAVTGSGTADGTRVTAPSCFASVAGQAWVPYNGGWQNPNSGKCLAASGTALVIAACDGSTGQQWALSLGTTAPVNDGKWHHVVLTTGLYNPDKSYTQQVLYLDGSEVGSTAGASLKPGPQAYGYLGAGYTGNGWSGLPAGQTQYFTGTLAEVAVYDRALSGSEVQTHYQEANDAVPLVITAASGDAATVPLADTAAGTQSPGKLPAGATAVDAAAHEAGTAAISDPVGIVPVTDPGGHRLLYSYDLITGQLTEQTDALGNVTLYGYDAGGYQDLTVDPDGHVTRTVQDDRGNTIQRVTCQDQAAGKCSSSYYSYYWDAGNPVDPRNNLVTAARGPGSASAADSTYLTTYTYDAAGNLLSTRDPLGRTTTVTYTDGKTAPAGLPWKIVDPSGGLETLTYTAAGDVATVTDPAGAVTSYAYDLLGRELRKTVVTSSFPAGRTTSYTYNQVGQVLTETDPAVTNRVTGAVHTQVTTSAYGLDGFLTKQTVSDATGGDAPRTAKFRHDPYGHVSTVIDAAGGTTTYTYDSYGHLTGQTDPDGVTTAYDVDPDGNRLSVTLRGYTGNPNDPQSPADLVVESSKYDPAGRLASTTDALGDTTSYTYTDDGRTATVTRSDPAGDSFALQGNSYDAAGNLVSQQTDNKQTTTTYSYDAAGRQTGSVLDPGGLNRVTALTLSPDGQVTSSKSENGSGSLLAATGYSYDVAGRLVAQTSYDSDPATTPLARWKLDEASGSTAADSAGNSPGTAVGLTWAQDAQRGQVASFDGTTSQITTAGPVLDTTRAYTIAAWLKPDAAQQDGTVLEVPGATGDQPAFRLSFDAAAGQWKAQAAGYAADGSLTTSSVVSGAGTAQAGAWQHVTVEADPATGTWTLFLNGAAAASSPAGPAGVAAASGVDIGGAADGMFSGEISDLQVYQSALSAGQVAAVYAGTAPAAGSAVSRTSSVLDDGGLATAEINPLGSTTYIDYDQADRPVVSTGPAVRAEAGDGTAAVTARPVTAVGYDTFGDRTEQQDANGDVTTYGFDALGQQVQTQLPAYTPPGGSATITPVATTAYDKAGQVTARTDPLGQTTSYAYDQLGRLVTQTNPDGGQATMGYDLDGNLLTETDPTGAQTGYSYNMLGQAVTASQADRQSGQADTTTNRYTTAGQLASETSPDGVQTRYSYDPAGDITSVTSPAGDVISYAYDALGRPVKQVNPDGTFTTTAYDMLSRQTATASYAAGGTTALTTASWVYDAAGDTIAATGPQGATTRYSYDAAGNLTGESQPVTASTAITTSFGYDLAGNPTRFTDGRGNSFLTTYNSWGLVQSQADPATAAYPGAADRTWTTTYDAAGQAVSQAIPGGVTQTFGYDSEGNLVKETGTGAQAATADRSYGYDKDGRLTSFSAPGGTDTVSYDDLGLPLSVTGPSGSSSFTYNGDGLMTSRTDAAGTTAYSYDGADRLSSVTDAAAGVSAGYSYNAMSQLASVTYGAAGGKRTFGYDSLHRLTSDTLTSASGATVASVGYGYDAAGDETAKTVTVGGVTTDNTYTYDLAGRLTSWDNGTATTGYAYDASGNLTKAGATTYAYNAQDQLTSDSAGTSYVYTARGTLAGTTAADGTATASTADAFDQVATEQTAAGTTEDYSYDALGRVVRDGFSYTGLGNNLAADGTASYLRDPGGTPVAVSAGGTTRLLLTDQHDDVIAQADAGGTAVTGTATYSPLGEVTATSGMLGNLGYQSEWTDPATGQVNMAARWYNPATAQFDSRDTASNSPVPDSVAANRYQYGDGNPLTTTDPTGHGKAARKIKHWFKKNRLLLLGTLVSIAVEGTCIAATEGTASLGCALAGSIASSVFSAKMSKERAGQAWLDGAIGIATLGVMRSPILKLPFDVLRNGTGKVVKAGMESLPGVTKGLGKFIDGFPSTGIGLPGYQSVGDYWLATSKKGFKSVTKTAYDDFRLFTPSAAEVSAAKQKAAAKATQELADARQTLAQARIRMGDASNRMTAVAGHYGNGYELAEARQAFDESQQYVVEAQEAVTSARRVAWEADPLFPLPTVPGTGADLVSYSTGWLIGGAVSNTAKLGPKIGISHLKKYINSKVYPNG